MRSVLAEGAAVAKLTDRRRKGWKVRKSRSRDPWNQVAGSNVLRLPKTQTLIVDRLTAAASVIRLDEPQDVAFQHSILCQTCLPYRNPGDEVRSWERMNGTTHLEIDAGKAMHAEMGRLVPVGLPFGPKPRLVLAYINTEALRTGSPEVEVEGSLTAFVKRLGFVNSGRNIQSIKDQLTRLAAARITMGVIGDHQAMTINANIVTAFNLWFPKDERQRVLWPSTVRLSTEYFESLQAHAVPLDERALAALSHSAMGLDIYAWLAQRLHRVKPGARQFIPWTNLKEQFGTEYDRLRKFREVFMVALRQVHAVYPAAKIDITDGGAYLFNSPPPIPKAGMQKKLLVPF